MDIDPTNFPSSPEGLGEHSNPIVRIDESGIELSYSTLDTASHYSEVIDSVRLDVFKAMQIKDENERIAMLLTDRYRVKIGLEHAPELALGFHRELVELLDHLRMAQEGDFKAIGLADDETLEEVVMHYEDSAKKYEAGRNILLHAMPPKMREEVISRILS